MTIAEGRKRRRRNLLGLNAPAATSRSFWISLPLSLLEPELPGNLPHLPLPALPSRQAMSS
jgi:hypothetical protein